MARPTAILTLVVLLTVPAVASAQSHGGIIGGAGSAGWAAEDDDVQDAVEADFAYSVGLQGRFRFQEYLAVKPELLFSRRTTRLEGGALGFEFENKYGISYLEVPLLVRAAVPVADIFAPKVFVGPHASVFLDGQQEGDVSGNGFTASDSNDLDSEDVRNLQVGITAGVGLDINFDAVVFTSGLRYVRHFTPIFEQEEGDNAGRVRHESWLLMAGLMY